MPFLSEAPFLPEAFEATEADEAEAWELGESDTEGEAELDEFEAEAVYEEPPAAPELEEVGAEVESEGRALERAHGEIDPEFEVSEAAVDAVFGAAGAEAEAAFEEQEAETWQARSPRPGTNSKGWTPSTLWLPRPHSTRTSARPSGWEGRTRDTARTSTTVTTS